MNLERGRARLKATLAPHTRTLIALAVGLGLGGILFRSCQEDHDHEERPEAPSATASIWTCSMHPQIRQPEPGQCPICGMDLIPVPTGEDQLTARRDRATLSPRARVLAKLATVPVRTRAEATSEVRLLGRLEPDETTSRTVSAWTSGRLDRLHINTTGQRVRAGEVIATIYSPEIFAAQQDLLVAANQAKLMAESREPTRATAEAALAAARARLELLGVPKKELARMETMTRPEPNVSIYSPFAGTIIERLASEGAYINTGDALYRIADLGRLWAQLDAYESDLPSLALGQRVRLAVDAAPHEELEGKITFIDPVVDESRRTARARVAVQNRKGLLRPGMFVQAIVAATPARDKESPLVVPASAPLFTGKRAVVYVEHEEGERRSYEPRTVRLGPRLGDTYPVVAGLSAGERVVVRGAFLLDADLQIRGGDSMMTLPDDRQRDQNDEPFTLPSAERAKLEPVLRHYLELQEALAKDALPEAKAAAMKLAKITGALTIKGPPEARAASVELARGLTAHARGIETTGEVTSARGGFEALSEDVFGLLRRFGNPLGEALAFAFCPMAFGNRGAFWIQRGEVIDNPYFGATMRRCGEIRQKLTAGAFLTAPQDNKASLP